MRLFFRKRRRGKRDRQPSAHATFTGAELEQAIAAAAAPVYLVASRVLRRVIRRQWELAGLQYRIPHGEVFVIARARLVGIVEWDELGLPEGAVIPERVILLRRPDLDELKANPAAAILTQSWRSVFHGMVHLAAENRIARGELPASNVRDWIDRLGIQEFAEMCEVLRQERLLLGSHDPTVALIEAAAVFWELYYFSPHLLPIWFPAIEEPERVAELFRELVEPAPLFSASRPKGAKKPVAETPAEVLGRASTSERLPDPPGQGLARRLLSPRRETLERRADRAAGRGNLVRAMILRARVRLQTPRETAGRARAIVRETVDRLIHQLLEALQETHKDPDAWRAPLINLVQLAARGSWTVEQRLLYDLQKVSIDHQRGTLRLDVVGWLFSLGRRPLRCPLPHQKGVLICRHLHSARRRLARVRLEVENRRTLDGLLQKAAEKAEDLVRAEIRPLIRQAFRAAGFSAESPAETVAGDKLIEELLDQIVERGFLTMGDLRDALARNQLKLPDLAHPAELAYGDQLLLVDRHLAGSLGGVHRRGEFYLRWMQAISSLAFGTPWGRVFTKYMAVPFGGAYALEAGIQHMIHKLTGAAEASSPVTTFSLGMLFLALLNSEQFRVSFWRLMQLAGRGVKFCLIEFPKRMINIPAIRRVLQSAPVRFGYRLAVKPAMFTAVFCAVVSRLLAPWQWSTGGVATVFCSMVLVLNSRLGRDMGEIATEWLLEALERVGIQSLAALFRWVMEVFRSAVDAVDRLLYAMDEWLRFRTGEHRAMLAIKALLIPGWLVLRYVVRFAVNLLIEPQINPIKHFPVVTVSHKILLPFIPALAGFLTLTMDKATAYLSAATIIALIPGACGFLVWELRENWRLYQANRPKKPHPTPVGSHGETVGRLLRPGFHSGTIPKRYARLRRAAGNASTTGKWEAVRNHLLAIRDIELSLRRYVERELIATLRRSAAWDTPPLAVRAVSAHTNRIVVHLVADGEADRGARLELDLSAGHLVARFIAPGWLERLDDRQLTAFRDALECFYGTTGADFDRHPIDSDLPSRVVDEAPRQERMEHQDRF
ncbi:MAG: hypothetical protein PHN77_06660 [Thermoguttaceae bacterium]|nr:hypothetical protein [Thermoguttaceae bacterium]